jgi:hypothetical protein
MLSLSNTVASSRKVISAPQESGILRTRSVRLIHRIETRLSLCGFMNDTNNSVAFGLLKIYVSIVMREVNDCI